MGRGPLLEGGIPVEAAVAQLLTWKNKHSLPVSAVSDLLDLLAYSILPAENSLPSTWKQFRAVLDDIAPVEKTEYDCCVRSCCAFTGDFVDNIRCPYCNERRYIGTSLRPRKVFTLYDMTQIVADLCASEELSEQMK